MDLVQIAKTVFVNRDHVSCVFVGTSSVYGDPGTYVRMIDGEEYQSDDSLEDTLRRLNLEGRRDRHGDT